MRLRLLMLVAAMGVALAAQDEAYAQFRFSVGGNGWSVGNAPYGGYGYGGYGYGSGWGGYSPYYGPSTYSRNYRYYDDDDYLPAQAVQARPNPPYQGPGVIVRNPAKSEVTLAYIIDDSREFSIAAGESQRLVERGKYTVEFDRGGQFGTARYTISEGLYEFTQTDHGWELYRQKDSALTKPADSKVKPNPLPASGSESPGKDT